MLIFKKKSILRKIEIPTATLSLQRAVGMVVVVKRERIYLLKSWSRRV